MTHSSEPPAPHSAPSAAPSLDDRRRWLQTLLARQPAMLAELALVAGIVPATELAADPLGRFDQVAAFVDRSDFRDATEDARIWLLNRLGLYLASHAIARHGGRLVVQDDPRQRFYLGFVVTEMHPPVPAEARLDPFALAFDAIHAWPRIGLATLLETAERALVGTPRG